MIILKYSYKKNAQKEFDKVLGKQMRKSEVYKGTPQDFRMQFNDEICKLFLRQRKKVNLI